MSWYTEDDCMMKVESNVMQRCVKLCQFCMKTPVKVRNVRDAWRVLVKDGIVRETVICSETIVEIPINVYAQLRDVIQTLELYQEYFKVPVRVPRSM